MKVYLELPTKSRGITRVYDALVKYKPFSIDIVKDPKQADLHIIHVIGRYDSIKSRIERLNAIKKPYVLIQYCLKSTMRPKAIDWLDLWQGARLVWSYYDLPAIIREEELYWVRHNTQIPFYHAPLGVDSSLFKDLNVHRTFIVGTSSQHALSEGVRECVFAAKRIGRPVFHLGHELRRGEDVVCKGNLSDEDVAYWFSRCEFVSGLRRVEGFELPVIEGLLCGARPIVYDRPEMRQWYDDLAVFIKEGTRDEVINQLEEVFKKGAQPVTDTEKDMVRHRFNWESIITNFWNKIV